MKLDNETKSWLDEQARQGCNQRDVANQLMQRINTTDPPPYVLLTYEQAVNLYKSARKRVRKTSVDMLIAKTQIQCDDDKQVYVHHSPASVTSEPNGAPAGILIPVEADDLRMLQVSPEGPEQAPETSTPSQPTPPPSAAPPEPSVNDPSLRAEEVVNSEFKSALLSAENLQIAMDPKPEAPQVKSFRDALNNYIEDVAMGGLRHFDIEEHYANDADLVDRLVLLLGPGIKGDWDRGTVDHDRILTLFKDAIENPAGSTTDPNNDRIYEAQLVMYNGIRDLTDAVRALPIASVIAAKDEAIAAKDAELETLREYVKHLQRQIGAA